MCDAGDIGKIWTRQLLMGAKGFNDAARFFHMPAKDILTHINTHHFDFDEQTGEYDSPDFYLKELLKVFKLLKAWLDYLVTQPNLSQRDIDLGLRLSREVRETLKTLGDFQGRFDKSDDDLVNIEMLNRRYMTLTETMLHEVCPKCQVKVLKILDQQSLPEIT